MERLAVAFLFVHLLIKPGHAIPEHTLVLFAPPAVVRFDRAGVQPHRHQLDIDKFGVFDIAWRLRIDRSRDVRRPFGHVSRAC
jgi:hypothetical protein